MKRAAPVVVMLALALALWLAGAIVHDRRLERQFGKIAQGMTTVQVNRVMGRPSWQDVCGTNPDAGPPPAGCRREAGYTPTLSPDGEDRIIRFAADGTVLQTAKIVSP